MDEHQDARKEKLRQLVFSKENWTFSFMTGYAFICLRQNGQLAEYDNAWLNAMTPEQMADVPEVRTMLEQVIDAVAARGVNVTGTNDGVVLKEVGRELMKMVPKQPGKAQGGGIGG